MYLKAGYIGRLKISSNCSRGLKAFACKRIKTSSQSRNAHIGPTESPTNIHGFALIVSLPYISKIVNFEFLFAFPTELLSEYVEYLEGVPRTT